MQTYTDVNTGTFTFRALTNHAAESATEPVLWPSIGEYPIYDPALYHALESDHARNDRFRNALRELAKDKVVLDIGTGEHLLWAREGIDAGAHHAVAIEVIEDSHTRASENVIRHGLDGKITLLHGLSTRLDVTAKADVCVAEVIGSVAGAEGAAAVFTDARRRLLKPNARCIPHRCVTQAAAVSLREVMGGDEPAFGPGAVPLLQRIMAWNQGLFDVRLRIRNPVREAIVSGSAAVEILDFNGDLRLEQERRVTLVMERPGRIDGILAWLQLACLPDETPLDALRDRTSWASVYFPLFHQDVPVSAGDRLHVTFRTVLSDDGIHPDYRLGAVLHTERGELSAHLESPHHGTLLHGHPLYERLLRPI
ncbi:hypothetical protein [Streptosporangium sandarakinum]|uniref:hypothetical protein n=1 Tax=Streptosporangium sandarakinum TaxID=1260955 RepID=UPI003441AC2C